MNYTVFFSILAFFAILYLVIGQMSSKKIKNNEDYFLNRRRFGGFTLTLSLLATQIGGGSLAGASQEAYDKGWVVLFYPLGISIGLFLLSMGFGKKMRSLQISTIAELFEKKYGSKMQRKIVSIISIITMFLILIGQGIGIRKFLFFLGFESNLLFLLFWGVLTFYTIMGGIKAVVYTDVIQTIFTMIIFALVLMLTFKSNAFSSLAGGSNVSFASSSVPWSKWLIMPMLFMLMEQDMGQRCFAAKSSKSLKYSGVLSSILLFLCSLFAIFFGTIARKLNLPIEAGSSVLLTSVSNFVGPTVLSLFAISFLMVIISTADSLLCSIGSNIAFDFPYFKNMKKAKLATFIIGLIAALFSIYFDKIVSLFIISYEFSISVLFVPIMAAFFLDNLSKKVSFISMLFGFLGFCFFKYFSNIAFGEIYTLSLSLLSFYFSNKILSKIEMKKIRV